MISDTRDHFDLAVFIYIQLLNFGIPEIIFFCIADDVKELCKFCFGMSRIFCVSDDMMTGFGIEVTVRCTVTVAAGFVVAFGDVIAIVPV